MNAAPSRPPGRHEDVLAVVDEELKELLFAGDER